MFHKIAFIKFFNKTSDDATIGIIFNKFISNPHDYEYSGWTPESLDGRTFLTLINDLINPIADLRWNIKSCERVENKGVVFTAQQVMAAVINYAQVPVTIQS